MIPVYHYDAHFHFQTSEKWLRHFLFNRSVIERQKKWWDYLQHPSRNIQIIVSTEHAYANPEESYQLLKKSKPRDYDAVVLPGIEALTKEGIDIIVFSLSEEIFKDENILKPCKHNLIDLCEIINKNNNYQGILPHPFGATPNAAWPRITIPEIQDVAKTLGLVERYNFTSHGMYTKEGIISTLIGFLTFGLVSGRSPLVANENLNGLIEYCKKNNVGFTVGSDAHNPEDLKSLGTVAFNETLSVESAFYALRNNRDPKWSHPENYSDDKPLHTLFRTNLRIFEEYGYFKFLMNNINNGNEAVVDEFYNDIHQWFDPNYKPNKNEFKTYFLKQAKRIICGYLKI